VISVTICTPDGSVRRGQVPKIYELSAVCSENRTTGLSLRCGSLPRSWLVRNARISLFYHVGGRTHLVGGAVWLVKMIKRKRHGVEIEAESGGTLIDAPIVAHSAGTDGATISGLAADDAIKRLARENMIDRGFGQYISVADDTGYGPTIDKAFSRRQLASVIEEIAEYSRGQGYPIYYDVVQKPAGLAFRTWPNLRGRERSIVLSEESGGLIDAASAQDWRDEVTAVYAGGRGVGSNRAVRQRVNDEEIDRDPFARSEMFLHATQLTTSTALDAAADTTLAVHKARQYMGGMVAAKYGKEWQLGDRVRRFFDGQNSFARVESIEINASSSGVEVRGYLIDE